MFDRGPQELNAKANHARMRTPILNDTVRLCIPRSHGDRLTIVLIVSCFVLGVSITGCQKASPPVVKDAAVNDPAPQSLTFARDIAPLVFAKCAPCHHPGEAAPFSLLSYEDVRARAKQIVDVTQKRFMPPWLPAAGEPHFDGERILSTRELRTLEQWVAFGAAPGEAADLPPVPDFPVSWRLGEPDLVVESPPYRLASQDRDVFRNFVVPFELAEPRWIQSIEIRPENPRVTHHARLGVDSSNESLRRDAEDDEPGYAGMAWGQDPDGQLVIWAPGMSASPSVPGVAWRVYPKTCLVLHTHMQPSGKPEVVRFKIGVRFAASPPELHPALLRIGSCDIDIAAGAKHHVVSDQYVLPIAVDVRTIFPHAHSLCQNLRVDALLPDGTQQTLIDIPHFDENWHESYRYPRPLRLPCGTRLVSTFAYDNTAENIRNRNHPPRRVVYGSNVTDEMADVYLQVTAAIADQRAVLMEDYKTYELKSQAIGYRKSLDLYPDNPWSKEGLATCYVGLENPNEAIAVLQSRLESGPSEVFPLVSLGMALLAKGEIPAAEERFRKAIRMDDQYPLAWFGLGKTLAAQKQAEPAEQAFRRATELAPGMVDAELNLAELLVRRGRAEDAIQVCQNAIASSPDTASIYVKLGEIAAMRRDYTASLNYFQTARTLAPYTHPAKVLLAISCIANGEIDRGQKLLGEAREESPEHPMSALLLGQLASRDQQWTKAREYLAAAVALPLPENWPGSHKKRFLVLLHSERAKVGDQLQDLSLKRDALTQWLKCDPENSQLRKMFDAFEAESR
jgi:tetratricopeptide (TPR) repeat protein